MSRESHWAVTAKRVIFDVHQSLPEGVKLKDRQAAIDAAYPFGERKYTPYKIWLRERCRYLTKYGYVKRGKKLQESPLERLMRRSGGKNE